MQPGEVHVLNDPYHGGTHLPDITVITPGSMPPFSTRIEEEGVQINNFKLVDRGVLREAEMIALLQSGEYPSRNPQQNMADLKAQIAANEKGVQELGKMVEHFGLDVVQDNAEKSVRRVITRLKDGAFTMPLDNGAQIQVAIRVNTTERSAVIDFSGTSAQQSNNFNAPTAVCKYYETIAGGSGAGVTTNALGAVIGGFNGTDVVQTHMTNSRLTGPEILEFRFPVRLESYEIRQGSGGQANGRGAAAACGGCAFWSP